MGRFILFVLISLYYLPVLGQSGNDVEQNGENSVGQEEAFDYAMYLEEEITGVWINNSMIVQVNSFNNSDTSFIVDINEETWDMKMNIKPIVTIIREDGTYSSEFRTSFDSLIYRPEGTWMIDGDTLIMQDHQKVYKYQIFVDGDRAEFKNLIDWDNDGKTDDFYSGVQIRKR